ncbi:hypothetical protein C8J57DRAFT_1729018 [Mycena rebaudengoi]|nr:hypothetical protein C8J57DRAFT_1729018 [Mycena rebaudengoi]
MFPVGCLALVPPQKFPSIGSRFVLTCPCLLLESSPASTRAARRPTLHAGCHYHSPAVRHYALPSTIPLLLAHPHRLKCAPTPFTSIPRPHYAHGVPTLQQYGCSACVARGAYFSFGTPATTMLCVSRTHHASYCAWRIAES